MKTQSEPKRTALKSVHITDCFAVICVVLAAWSSHNYLKVNQEAVESLNNTARSIPNLLFFNRVHKTGSQTLWALLDRLAPRNDFTSYNNDVDAMRLAGKVESMIKDSPLERGEIHKYFSMLYQREQEKKNNSQAALSYVRHIHYIDLEEFQPGFRPTWISVVRNPLERAISWYYYHLTPWYRLKFNPELNETVLTGNHIGVRNLKTSLDECVELKMPDCSFAKGQKLHEGNMGPAHASQVAFFCGHDAEVCGEFGSEAALARAMENVEKSFAVVGITEEYQKTLEVLEAFVPRFFKNAREIYKETMDEEKVNKNSFKPEVSLEVKNELRKNLTLEFEFYNFCRQRLDIQHSLIT